MKLRFLGTWVLLVTGGRPTPDQPDVVFAPPPDASTVNHEMTIRVPDCRAAYEALQAARGIAVGGACFFRDPEGHRLKISEARSS